MGSCMSKSNDACVQLDRSDVVESRKKCTDDGRLTAEQHGTALLSYGDILPPELWDRIFEEAQRSVAEASWKKYNEMIPTDGDLKLTKEQHGTACQTTVTGTYGKFELKLYVRRTDPKIVMSILERKERIYMECKIPVFINHLSELKDFRMPVMITIWKYDPIRTCETITAMLCAMYEAHCNPKLRELVLANNPLDDDVAVDGTPLVDWFFKSVQSALRTIHVKSTAAYWTEAADCMLELQKSKAFERFMRYKEGAFVGRYTPFRRNCGPSIFRQGVDAVADRPRGHPSPLDLGP